MLADVNSQFLRWLDLVDSEKSQLEAKPFTLIVEDGIVKKENYEQNHDEYFFSSIPILPPSHPLPHFSHSFLNSFLSLIFVKFHSNGCRNYSKATWKNTTYSLFSPLSLCILENKVYVNIWSYSPTFMKVIIFYVKSGQYISFTMIACSLVSYDQTYHQWYRLKVLNFARWGKYIKGIKSRKSISNKSINEYIRNWK